MIPQKLITTVSRYNGLQITIEAKSGDRWRYLAVGIHDGVEVNVGSAIPVGLDDSIRSMASAGGEEAARYAASHRGHRNFRTLLDTR